MQVGRLIFTLFDEAAPRATDNFRALCCGTVVTVQSKEDGSKPQSVFLHYKGSRFHRVVPGFMCQGGDVIAGDAQSAIVWRMKSEGFAQHCGEDGELDDFWIRQGPPGTISIHVMINLLLVEKTPA